MLTFQDIKGKYLRNNVIIITQVIEKSISGVIIGKHSINKTNLYFDGEFYYFYNSYQSKYYAMEVSRHVSKIGQIKNFFTK